MKVIFVLGFGVLAACQGAPVGIGGTYETISQSESAIAFKFDPLLANRAQMAELAQAHCASFGKNASEANVTNNLVITVSYNCV